MSAKVRKYLMALTLLLVYTLTIGSMAYHVLTCHCGEALAEHTHVCCHTSGCKLHGDCANHTTDINTSCGCGVDHSRTEDLYTASSSSERSEKSTAVLDLPYALQAEAPVLAQNLPVQELIFERPVLLYGTFAAPTVGLRAPPVFV